MAHRLLAGAKSCTSLFNFLKYKELDDFLDCKFIILGLTFILKGRLKLGLHQKLPQRLHQKGLGSLDG